jgi:hypothetical protein
MDQYRFSKGRAEIIKALSSKLNGESLLTVWQKNENGSRSFLERMPFHELFADEGVFTLKVTKEHIAHIDSTKDIYFLLEEHDFIFKTKMAIDQKSNVTFQIPREVRLKELRAHERQYFTLEERKFVDVIFAGKENEISLSCPLINISVGGACIVVSKETLSSIDFSATIQVKYLSEFQTAAIRNARVFIKRHLNQDELYAIGVQFA